ncbi:hypothetical protein HDU67_003031 [Dinochytrium kinnereticum]|nr:hypothetical protein HDU67_003031 [Dinochytrium kinnereticum]
MLSNDLKHAKEIIEILKKDTERAKKSTCSIFENFPLGEGKAFSTILATEDSSTQQNILDLQAENDMKERQVSALQMRLKETQKSSVRCMERFQLREAELLGDIEFFTRHMEKVQLQSSLKTSTLEHGLDEFVYSILSLVLEGVDTDMPRFTNLQSSISALAYEILNLKSLLNKVLACRRQFCCHLRITEDCCIAHILPINVAPLRQFG